MTKTSTKLSFRERIDLLFKGEIPTSLKTARWRSLSDEQESFAETLDVDTLHGIIHEAQQGRCERLWELYRDVIAADSHLQTEFAKRKIAVLGDVLSIQPRDKKNVEDVAAGEAIQNMIDDQSGWTRAMAHLMDSVLWPVAVIEKVYKPIGNGYILDELFPVSHQLLDYTTGKLMILDTDDETGRVLDTFHAPDPRRYIVHRGHILSAPDHWGGPMRSILFWWLLSTMDRTWWAQFLDKYGTPFPVGKYDQADDASRSILMRAFATAKKLGGLVISKETEVELVEAAKADAGDAYDKFLSICQREKSKLVLGQTLSAEAQSTGLGSGVSNQQESVRQDIRQFDALLLGQTLRDQLFRQYIEINSIAGEVPRAIWGAVSPEEQKALGELLKSLKEAGLELTEDGVADVGETTGLPLQRSALPVSPPLTGEQPQPFSAKSPGDLKALKATEDPEDAIMRNGSAEMQAFRGTMAPVRQAILESTSADDLTQRLKTLYADYSPGRLETITAEALTAFSANAAVITRE